MVAYPRFTQFHLNYPQDSWNYVLQTDETTVEMFGYNAQNHICSKQNTAYQHTHLILTAKHSGGGVMIWASFSYNPI